MEAAAHGDEPVQAPERRPSLRGRLLPGSSDERLVARIRAGDERAFEILFDRYHRGLLAFARHMLASREEAEDAVQHTLLQAYRSLRGSDSEVRLKPWLYTIARNRCLSVLRARRDEVALDDAPPSVDGLASEVQRREDLQAMLADMRRLPDEQREALVLFELGDLPHDEIADVLGVRKDKVKALVFQARESLMASRIARETPCAEIREQLSSLRGAALRRGPLRRHVDQCAGCQAFEAEVKRQRAAMALLLPVVPSLAFKGSVLGALAGGHASAGAGAAGLATATTAGTGAATTAAGGAATGIAAAGAKGLVAKALVALAVAGAAGGGGYVAVHDISKPATPRSHTSSPGSPAGTTTPSGTVTPAHPSTPAHGQGVRAHGPGHGLAKGHAEHHGKGKALGHGGTPVAAGHAGHGSAGAVKAHGAPAARRPAHGLVEKLHARRRGRTAPRRGRRHHPAATPVAPTHTTAPQAKAPKGGSGETTTTTPATTTPTATAPTSTTPTTSAPTTSGGKSTTGALTGHGNSVK